jgi:hypothetical protein
MRFSLIWRESDPVENVLNFYMRRESLFLSLTERFSPFLRPLPLAWRKSPLVGSIGEKVFLQRITLSPKMRCLAGFGCHVCFQYLVFRSRPKGYLEKHLTMILVDIDKEEQVCLMYWSTRVYDYDTTIDWFI